jgi:hypothetical protein
MLKKILFFCIVLIALKLQAQTEDRVLHVVYLLGNTATAPIPEANMAAFQQELQAQSNPFTIIHLGDILDNNGLGKNEKVTSNKLDLLLQLANVNPKGNIFFVPGDKDWDNSGPAGLSNVRRLELYMGQNLNKPNLLVPGNGCPGPQIIDISPNLRIIAINTQWWMHPYQKPEEPNTDCQVNTREDFLEELDDAISEAEGRNVLIVGHHPILSNGEYGGHLSLKKHFFPLSDGNPNNRVPLPLLGSVYAAYRQNIGTPRDMANKNYQDFTKGLGDVLAENNHVIYAAAHDYNLQLNYSEGNYHLISGSFSEKDFLGRNKKSLFNRATQGFSKLTYYTNGKTTNTFYEFTKNGAREISTFTLFQSPCAASADKKIPVNNRVGPCSDTPVALTQPEQVTTSNNTTTVVAGPQYEASRFKRLFLGDLYRQSWIQPVKVPYLYLSQTDEKLRPQKLGGGRQTTSLRLKADDGRQFVFRSVDKDPIAALPPEFRNTVITDIIRQITPTEHPYGALVVSSLLDSTDILHARPKLFVLADDPVLGPFREKYKGLFGMLEERPIDPVSNNPGFGGSEDVKNNFAFLRQLYKDHDNRVDAQAFGKARAFDIFIGDWGRHPDNWRWAGYKTASETTFRPIPRDRDHAFSRWNGIIPWVADREWLTPNIQNFDADIHGIRSLTWPARHLDRYLLTSLSRQDWINFAHYLQERFPDPVIDKAISELPPEVASGQGKEIGKLLKARRAHLPEVLQEYYEMLARYVDVVGSNKNEYFKAERLPDANVRVRMYKKEKGVNTPKGDPLFDRTFLQSETKEIRLFGLDGKDVFDVTGNAKSSIRLRIIGGQGKDSIRDASTVKSLRKQTLVYDSPDTKLELGPESRNLTSNEPRKNQYNRQAFEYNSYNPGASILYNISDGFGITGGINYKRQRFGKPDYGSLYSINARATQNGNLQLTTDFVWRQALNKWDVGTIVDAGRYFPFYNFYGLGNHTVKNETLYDNKFYVARYSGVIFHGYVQRQFFRNSYFRVGPRYETLTTTFKTGTLLDKADGQQGDIADQELAGGTATFNLDLRDKPVFTQKGLRFYVTHSSYQRLQGIKDYFGITQSFLDYYTTTRILLPITLAVRVGGAKNYGDNLPFFKYTTLGLYNNLRGFVRNRFAGDASAYLNTELRFHIGQVNSTFMPFRYGLITFYDQGKVWHQGNDTGGWHQGYGAGFYISPFAERFTFSTIFQHSTEESLLFQFGAGFRFDN